MVASESGLVEELVISSELINQMHGLVTGLAHFCVVPANVAAIFDHHYHRLSSE